MANEEHLALLRRGVEVWNQWRKENPEVRPNLKGVNFSKAILINAVLSGADLRGADLRKSDLGKLPPGVFATGRVGPPQFNKFDNPFAEVSLSGVDFRGADLRDANLSEAILRGANLNQANLSEADLSEANLSEQVFADFCFSGAVLSKANLSQADLNGINLSSAKLSGANLNGANLSRTNLSGANLSGASFDKAITIGANFSRANLSKANLSRASFSNINFCRADLREADLSRAFLCQSDFSEADLSGANLSEAILSLAKLNKANLAGVNLVGANLAEAILSEANLNEADLSLTRVLGTNFSGAHFTGTCLEDWNINSATNLDDVICDYIYLRKHQHERRPSSGTFAPGDFTKYCQKALETVDLIFLKGIDWQAFLASFQKLQVECGGEELTIQAIENKNDGAFVIRVNVPPDANKAEVEKYLKLQYELELKAVEEKYRAKLEAKDKEIIEIYRQNSTNLVEVVKTLAINQTITIQNIATAESNSVSESFNNDLREAKVANFANKVQDNARQQANQYNYAPEQKQTLAEAAAEIQQLLEQLEKTNPTATQVDKQAFVTAAMAPEHRSRIVRALEAGGEKALEEFLKNPYINVAVAIIKEWQKAE